MPTRRAILTTAGAAVGIIGAGAARWAWAPGLARARAPWSAAGESFGDPRLDALAFAILAPNPHNMQPWRFALSGDDRIDVLCDLNRRLPETDPFDRQITIGFGAMLELLRLAAAEKNYAVDIEPFPDGEPPSGRGGRLDARRIARVTLRRSATVAPDPMFAHALARRTTRAPFDPERPVTGDALAAVTTAVSGLPEGSLRSALDAGGTLAPERIAALKDIAARAWTIEWSTPATRRESLAVMRISNRAIDANPDGLALGGVGMGVLQAAGLVSRHALDRPGALAYEVGLEDYLAAIRSAMGFVWIATARTDAPRAMQLAAGRAWLRMNLAAQAIGLAIHPLSQALQEFPEMAAPYAAIHTALGARDAGAAPRVVQMFARIGYATFPEPAPRWPLEAKLATA